MFPRAKFPAQSTRLDCLLKKGNDTQALLARNSMRRPSWETSPQYRLYSSVTLVVCGNIWFLDSCNVLFGIAPTRVNHRFPYLRNFTLCHDGTCFNCLLSTNQNDLRNKSTVTPTIWSLWRSMKTFWNIKGRPFPYFSGDHCAFHHGMTWRHWSSWRRIVSSQKQQDNVSVLHVVQYLMGKLI